MGFFTDEQIMRGYEYEFEDYDEDFEGDGSRFTSRRCNRCGKDGLHWVITKAGWRLFDSTNTLHVCKVLSASEVFAKYRVA